MSDRSGRRSVLVDRLREDLTAAMRARDRAAVGILRSTLAAVANAEAVNAGSIDAQTSSGPIAGAASGLGATEIQRRELSEVEVRAIVAAERDKLLASAETLADAGEGDRAARLRAGAAQLDDHLTATSRGPG